MSNPERRVTGCHPLESEVKSNEMTDSKQHPQSSPGSLGRTACSFCRRRKLKCDRRSPCESCQKFGFECEYAGVSSGSPRPDVKSSRVRQLEDRLGQSQDPAPDSLFNSIAKDELSICCTQRTSATQEATQRLQMERTPRLRRIEMRFRSIRTLSEFCE